MYGNAEKSCTNPIPVKDLPIAYRDMMKGKQLSEEFSVSFKADCIAGFFNVFKQNLTYIYFSFFITWSVLPNYFAQQDKQHVIYMYFNQTDMSTNDDINKICSSSFPY